MRWKNVGLGMLLLVAVTGCVGAYGRGGRMDRAMRQDIQNNLQQRTCPESVWEEICESGRTLDEECIQECFE